MAQKEEPLTKEEMLGLGAMALAVFVIANDFTALSVALPVMERDFKTDVTTVQWIINGYALVFGVLIITGGRLADIFGRRHIFFLGSAIFAVFSLIGGLTTSAWMLILARGAMGIGGAMMWPAILGMTYALVPRSRSERPRSALNSGSLAISAMQIRSRYSITAAIVVTPMTW